MLGSLDLVVHGTPRRRMNSSVLGLLVSSLALEKPHFAAGWGPAEEVVSSAAVLGLAWAVAGDERCLEDQGVKLDIGALKSQTRLEGVNQLVAGPVIVY